MKEKYYGDYINVSMEIVRDKRLISGAKLLYGQIKQLSLKTGECWASDEYFAEVFQVSTKVVSNWLKNLEDNDRIKRETKTIIIAGNVKKARKIIPLEEKFLYQTEENFQQLTEEIFLPVTEEKFPYNNKDNNREEYYKPLNAEENFELIWQIYPKKENKSSAFKEYCLAFKRYKDNGYEDTQINRMFWHCVKEYAEQVEKEKREIKYIKNGSNFFKNIEDYIKPIKEYK